ncbi:MAG: hypothetical protein GWP08_12840 [Nitrospiraceae bacterium]|nr:hypothetical protein [Nitrospiraceae bacterium]
MAASVFIRGRRGRSPLRCACAKHGTLALRNTIPDFPADAKFRIVSMDKDEGYWDNEGACWRRS